MVNVHWILFRVFFSLVSPISVPKRKPPSSLSDSSRDWLFGGIIFGTKMGGQWKKPHCICYFKKRYYVNNALSNVNIMTLLGLEISQIVKILIGSLIKGQSGKDALDQSSNALTIMWKFFFQLFQRISKRAFDICLKHTAPKKGIPLFRSHSISKMDLRKSGL